MIKFDLNKSAYYYYEFLNKTEREIYKTILQALINVKPNATLPFSVSKDIIEKTVKFIAYDRPDVFWFAGGYTMTLSNGLVKSVSFEYRMNKSEIEVTKNKLVNSRFFKELDKLIRSKNNAFEKALVAYECIIKHTDYDSAAAASSSDFYDYAYNIDGVILKSKAVCSGYSKAFQYFMNRHEIYCTFVAGNTNRGRHAWNLINLSGYYYIDTTWGDPVFSNNTKRPSDYISYDFFCITTKDLKKSHGAIIDQKMPLCTDTRYNYYKYFNMISDSFSVNDVASRLVTAYRNGKNEAVIVYSSKQTYLLAKRELFENEKIFEALSKAKKTASRINERHVNYSTADDKNTIKIKLY